MSRQAATAGSVGAGKGVIAALVVVGTALAMLLIVRARPAPDPFDPRSSAADGATGLVELLERSGADVEIVRSAPEPGTDTRLLVLDDRLDDVQRADALDFVEAGGVAVVADPASTLHGGPDVDGGSTVVTADDPFDARLDVEIESNIRIGTCSIAALDRLRGLFVRDGLVFPVAPDDPQCFANGAQSFVIASQIGDGIVVGLGDNEVWINQYLRRADNAGLATALLAPVEGSTVSVLLGTGTATSVADVGQGDETLIDLVPTWIWMALGLAAVGFVVFAVSRSVSVGAVLDEPLVTRRAGSELVAATGNLMQRAKHASRAGWLLQSQLHRDLCTELHIDLAAPLADLDRALGTDVIEPLLLRPVADDTQLLALASDIDRIRKDVLP